MTDLQDRINAQAAATVQGRTPRFGRRPPICDIRIREALHGCDGSLKGVSRQDAEPA
jgi:hypothetical protein